MPLQQENNRYRTNLHLLAAVFLLVVASSVHAQDISALLNPLVISQTPQHPAPGESVAFRVESFSLDLPRSEITWLENGVVVARGTGQQEIVLTAGEAGATQVIEVAATFQGATTREEVIVRPVVIDLIWESPQSYAPPFYRSKTLPSHEAPVRVIALPQFSRAGGTTVSSPNSLVFTWRQDGRVLGSQSGAGKNVLSLEKPFPFRDILIQVRVESSDGGLVGTAAVTIGPADVNTLFYEKHPLLGLLFNRALAGTRSMQNDEVTVQAHPYFATGPAPSSFSFLWSLDGAPIENPSSDESLITLRRTNQNVERARLDVSFENESQSLQQSNAQVILRFTESGDQPFTQNGQAL